MTRIKQTSCPLCGSSDANTLYPNGGYCFSCRKSTTKTSSDSWIPPSDVSIEEEHISLPYDASASLSEEAVAWFSRYELDVPTLIKHGVLWSPSKQQVIYPFYENGTSLVAFQARNFSDKAKTKYYTKGAINDILPIYFKCSGNFSNTLVVVEDCASAIKLSRYVDSLPILGSGLSLSKVTKVAALYSSVLVWLDGDMFHKAQRIAERFQHLGVYATVKYTENDPKELDYTTLESIYFYDI